jgi:predicted CXXCH cytochrome family protein
MLQPAAAGIVSGDFSRGVVTLRGTRFVLARSGDRFTIAGAFPTAREEVHRVDYTLGSRRIQHYLTTLPDGRIVVLPPTWDVERGEWIHNLDIVNPDEATRNPVQVWNTNCFGCHVSGQDKGYDAAQQKYQTRWQDFGTNCERCHGPGTAHAKSHASGSATAARAVPMIVPTDLPPGRSTAICAACHSLRDITVPGFRAGNDYFDHFTPVLEYGQTASRDPAYWADGRPRRFSNDAIGLWQSRCFLEGGATCVTCHVDPHEPNVERNPQLKRTNDRLCTDCHQAIGGDPPRHTRHAAGSAGSACIACHMPRTVISLRARMPDHTIGVPAPENTARFGIPNACNECHQDEDASWAERALAQWYPAGRRRQLRDRAEAFTAARRREAGAVDRLTALLTDRRQPPLARANAAGYLRSFTDPRAEQALTTAAADEQTAVRATAVLGLGEARFSNSVTPALVRALSDASRVVRVGAALSLMNRKVTSLDGPAAPAFAQAKRDYLDRIALLSDDARVLLDAGKFHLLDQHADEAAAALEASLRLDGRLHAARYFLALARLAQGRATDARVLLTEIPKEDAQAPAAAALLAVLKEGAQSGFETLRIRGQVLIEGAGPLAGARLRTDALRGASMSQFAAQREFTARSGRDGEWSILGVTRGLWILEVTASDYLPHVLVVPIAMMLQPEPVPWDTSVSLQPVTAIAPLPESAGGPAKLLLDAADLAIARKTVAARDKLMQLAEATLDARALCAAGDIALLIRDPGLARRFFELAATADGKWYRPQLGIASAAMMAFDFDRAIKGYAAAREGSGNKRLERMLSLAVKDLQQIRTIGKN